MTAAWVACGVRARAMSRRRLGAATARRLASSPNLGEAVEALSATPYGKYVRPGQTLAEAQHAVSAAVLWHLRVLAGWVPHGDARVLRVLAGGFEVANTDERLRDLAGSASEPRFVLGSLTTADGRIQQATSVAQVREALAQSAWGDPGADTPAAIHLGMRLSWASRVAAVLPLARAWAAGAAALVIAREVLVAGQRPTEAASRLTAPLLGASWPGERTLAGLATALPPDARWALRDVHDPAELWQAEAAWWSRVEHEGFTLLRSPVTGPEPLVGSVAVLAADAWRVRAALAVAARGGGSPGSPGSPGALEAFDAMA
ncbi:MAG TPA: V-type ATPase subunit [Ornithinibacter sp.]|nr:V-type ATPase subunit [Ornithinibacter sp.]